MKTKHYFLIAISVLSTSFLNSCTPDDIVDDLACPSGYYYSATYDECVEE